MNMIALETYKLKLAEPDVVRSWRRVEDLDALKTMMSESMVEAIEGQPPDVTSPHVYVDDFDFNRVPDKTKIKGVLRSKWASESGKDFAWMTGQANEFFLELFRKVDLYARVEVHAASVLGRTQLFHCHLLHGPGTTIRALFHAFEYPADPRFEGLSDRVDLEQQAECLDIPWVDYEPMPLQYHNFVCSFDDFSELQSVPSGQLIRLESTHVEVVDGIRRPFPALYAEDFPKCREFASVNWFPNDPPRKSSLHQEQRAGEVEKANAVQVSQTLSITGVALDVAMIVARGGPEAPAAPPDNGTFEGPHTSRDPRRSGE
jgi:hypothetical protein